MKKTTLLIAFIILAINSFSQNVGIGLTTPAAKLQINSTSSASRPLLLLSDSIGGVSNTIEFATQSISNKWSLSSSLQSAANTSFLRFGFSGGVTPFTLLGDGKIGINNTNPATSLDVNGSINVTETIKANGVAGQPGQVLSLNSNGNINWTDFNEFKNHRTFLYQLGTITWTVPAGVTRIMFEGWGGGGGGSMMGGGGGGGYICGWYPVVAGDIISFQIGIRGVGSADATSGGEGGDTRINLPGETSIAFGGKGAVIFTGGGSGVVGKGGSFTPGLRSIGISGQDGEANHIDYLQTNATTFLEATIGGKGGNAGNTLYTGSAGGYRLYNPSTATQIREIVPNTALHPGGGGAGHYNTGISGAHGMVVIHY